MGYNIPIMKETMSVTEFYTKYAPTEAEAIKRFAEVRWAVNGGKPICPFCKKYRIAKYKGVQPYRCKDCRHRFTVKTRTILQSSHISVQKWLFTIYLMGVSRKGISSLQLSREIGVTQKSAWYMLQKVRECYDYSLYLSGVVEVDETLIGGKERNKHASKRLYVGGGDRGKTAVMGMKDRSGVVQGRVVENRKAETLQPIIDDRVAYDSTIITDEHGAYEGLRYRGYRHRVINHSARQYVDGMAHTNGIESFWALLKRGIYGTFHHISKKHLQRYVNEFAFRLNCNRQPSIIYFMRYTIINGNGIIKTQREIRA